MVRYQILYETSKLEPQNPVFLTEIGKLYLFAARMRIALPWALQMQQKAEAEKGVRKSRLLSEDFF